MFGIIADLISSVTTILLPAYLSIKALRSHDPAQLQPWLIYQTLLALTLLFESWFWLITWFPFYSWIRLGFLLYLVLPQTQGAIYLFQTYVEPFVAVHERQIDEFIGETHQKLETMGLSYVSQLIDFIREKILGQAAPRQTAGVPLDNSAAGYAQNLFSRFAMPDARTNAANLYGMLSGLSVPTGAPGNTRSRDMSSSSYNSVGELQMPSGSAQEKSNYIASERARLANMLRTLEKEQQTIDLAYGAESSTLPTSRSDASFESISHSDVLPIPPSLIPGGPGGQKFAAAANQGQRRTASGNWVTSWFAGTGPGGDESGGSRPGTGRSVSGGSAGGVATRGWNAAKEVTDAIQGMSSSVDTGDGDGPGRRY